MMLGRRGMLLGMVSLVAAGCAPLPGRTIDVVRPLLETKDGGPPPARDQWTGRYEDSRGAGELVVQLRRTATGIEGRWELRTGGGGVLTGTQVPNSSIVKFQLATEDATCFALLEGAGELTADRWTATYGGRDCRGAVTNGRFTLTKA